MAVLKRSLYEMLEHYIEERANGNHLIEDQCRQWLSYQGKNSEEIDDILIEFDDEWVKEQLQGNSRKKGRRMLFYGSIGFVSTSTFTIVLAFQGVLSYIPYGFVAFMTFIMLKGASEIRDAKYRKERRAIKWENWK